MAARKVSLSPLSSSTTLLDRWPHFKVSCPQSQASSLKLRQAILRYTDWWSDPPEFELSPRLVHSGWKTPIRYDFRDAPQTVWWRHVLCPDTLFCPAVLPFLMHMRILLRTRYVEWIVDVRPVGLTEYVTPWDIVVTLHQALHRPITRSLAQVIETHRAKRTRRWTGLRMIELLRGRTKFAGLSRMHGMWDTWVLHVL